MRNGAHAKPRPLCQVERRVARRAVREGAPLLPLTHHRRYRAAAMRSDGKQPLVPLAGLEPALLAELDFESSAPTNFTPGAPARRSDERRVGKEGVRTCGSRGETAHTKKTKK